MNPPTLTAVMRPMSLMDLNGILRPPLLAGLFALAFGVAHAQQSGDSSVQPNFAVGDAWTYGWYDELSGKDEQVAEVVRTINDDRSVDVSFNAHLARLSPDGNVVKNATGTYSPAEVKLRFPLAVGDRYTAEYSYHDSKGGNWTRQMSANVEAEETVQTKAGSFAAMRVHITGGWYPNGNAGGGGSFDETMWYAPQVKRFVKDVFQSIPRGRGVGNTTRTELLSYSVQ